MGVVGTILSWEGCTRAHPHLTHSRLRGSESDQDTWLETPSVSTHRPHHSSVPCHTAAKKGGLLAHPQGSCHHPPFWYCKGTWPPPGSRQLPLISPKAGAKTLSLVTSNTPSAAYTFLKREHLLFLPQRQPWQQRTTCQDHSNTHMAAPHAQDPGHGWGKGGFPKARV